MKGILVIILVLFAFSCKVDPSEKFKGQNEPVDVTENLIIKQRNQLKKDSLIIQNYLEKSKWDYSFSGTGLRYEIYEKTDGDFIQSGDPVYLKYVVTNLKNDTLYSSAKSGIMNVVVDHSRAESGLHEFLKLMKNGESGRVVIPYHLGHGLVGDDYKVPPLTSIVFDLKVLK